MADKKLSLQENRDLIMSKADQSQLDNHKYDSNAHFINAEEKNKVIAHTNDSTVHLTQEEKTKLASLDPSALPNHINDKDAHITPADRVRLDQLELILTTTNPTISLGRSFFGGQGVATKVLHNIGHTDYVVVLLPSGTISGSIGEYTVEYGAYDFTISNTGSATSEFKYLLVNFAK